MGAAIGVLALLAVGATGVARAQAPAPPAAQAPAQAPTPAIAVTPTLPPAPLGRLIPFAVPALEKPPVPIPRVELPPAPEPMPELPAPRIVVDPSLRPLAGSSSPRALACNPLGSVFGVASELLQCGRAKFQRGELEPARVDLAAAVQKSSDRQVSREARYWLAETLVRLRRPDAAEAHLALVARDDPNGELGAFAAQTLACLLLERGEAARALPLVEGLLRGGAPPELIPPARHVRGLALSALGRPADARDEWTRLLGQNIPRPLATEVTFWLGDTVGRLGDPRGAVARLQVFTAAGPHPLIEPGLLRLAWWRRAAGQPLEAVKTYRALLSAYPNTAEAPWARAGLVVALLDADDPAAARDELRELAKIDKTGRLSRPAAFHVARWLADKGRTDDLSALGGELLAQNLDAVTRAWVVVVTAEAQRKTGQAADARSQLELIRASPGNPALAAHATLRLAELDLEAREFTKARAAAEGLAGTTDPTVRAAALVVAAEAAYWGREYDRAAGLYERFLADNPKSPAAPAALTALAWAELRRGRLDEARRLWTRFALEQPRDPLVPSALLLASELAAKAGDQREAERLLDDFLRRYPNDDLAPVALLDRAILAIREGRSEQGLRVLRASGSRGSQSPHQGRLRLAQGIAELELGRKTEAEPNLRAALAEGEDLAQLGLGRLALERGDWDAATRSLVAARDAGSAQVAATAEYGLAAVLLGQGKKAEFRAMATPLVDGAADPGTTPFLLEAMAQLSGEEKKWPEARALTMRVVKDFARSPAAPRALAALGASAAADAQWPLSREAYETLIDRYPTDPAVAAAEVSYAEALLRTGAAPEARRRLEGVVGSASGAASPRDQRMARALSLLAESREAAGDRSGALETYQRLRDQYASTPGAEGAGLAQGRLLQAEGRWDEARLVYERGLASPDVTVAAQAAYFLGEGLRAAGRHQEAVEQYMTAAYLAETSPWARRALLGAGQSFGALRQRDAAEIVYKKLVAAKGAEPELVEAARKELRALGAN
jgi:TolA-binding protein